MTGLCFRMESLIRGYTNILLPIFTCKSFAKAVEKYRVKNTNKCFIYLIFFFIFSSQFHIIGDIHIDDGRLFWNVCEIEFLLE